MTWSGTQSLTTVAATNSAIWSSSHAPSRVLSRSQKTYSPGRISVIGLPVAISVWQWPPQHLWPWVLVVGVAGTFSHFCLAKAISLADATVVVPMDFLRVPLSALAGWLLYDEGVDIWLALGSTLILAGNVFNVQRRAREPEMATS